MKVYRIGKWKYLNDISGEGARINGGRWNNIGFPMVYTSSHLSLAILEMLANNHRSMIDQEYGYIEIEIPEDSIETLKVGELNENWRAKPYSQFTIAKGTTWLKQKNSLALKVPSSVLKQESNILLNPLHPLFSKVQITLSGHIELDNRVV